MKVVDPHVHFWDLDTHHYPWLANPGTSFVGDARDLKHNYLPANLRHDAGNIDVLKVVHVEANHDPADPVEETRWLQSLADAGDESEDARSWPDAIVAAADLADTNVEATLAAHAGFPRTRGIRQILNVHDNPLYDYVGRHYLRDDAWRRNFGLLAREHPDVALIVNHAGMFVDRDSVAGWRAWRDGLRTLAACPNVSAKISGLAMFDRRWTVESLRPYVLETIDAFGADRAMFASNFPVDRLFATYEDLWRAYASIVAGASDDERDALFRRNAERIYRLADPRR